MSRITPPVHKFSHAIRNMSSTASRSASLLEHSRHTSTSRYLPRNLSDLKAECSKRHLNTSGSHPELVNRLAAHDLNTRSFHTTGLHRPTGTTKAPTYKPIPLMQGFRSSAPLSTAHDTSTIDFFIFPAVPEPAPSNPFARVRVPLLPDNYTPDRSLHAVESLDTAVLRQEINIVAAHPERVATAMSEVVGNEGVEAELSSLTGAFGAAKQEAEREVGVFREVWSGILEDVFGGQKKVAV